MNSMTGYSFKEVMVDSTQISIEIKSVNSRFLDLSINLPPFLNPLEARIRKLACEKIVRGKVDFNIRVHDTESTATVTFDANMAVEYATAFFKISRQLPDFNHLDRTIPLSLIVSQDGVINVTHSYDAEAYWKKIEPVLNEVLETFVEDRKREGANLKKDLLEKLSILDECADFFAEWQPRMEEKFKETITSKFKELLGDHADENRIMQETAAMLVKYTINEEIIRLKSHLAAMRSEITNNPIPGKRLDFICQEANREINTIGSKNQFTEVGTMVIKAKDSLENIREQAKNVE